MNSDDLWRDLQQIRLENAMHFNEIQKMLYIPKQQKSQEERS